jgi:Holliday junction resolvase RusA-like endonuclease
LDNTAKAVLDALRGQAFEDDSQVVELHMFRGDDKERPRCEVEVYRAG